MLHTCTDQAEAENLVRDGVNVNAKNLARQTPLHSLMRLGNPKTIPVVLYLLKLEQVDVNAAEPDGTTVAHLCEWGPIMSALVKRKDFDPNKIRNSDGNTPLMFSITYPKHPDITKRLLESPLINLKAINPRNGKTVLQFAQEMVRVNANDKNLTNLTLITDKIANCGIVQDAAQLPGPPITPTFTQSICVAVSALAPAQAPVVSSSNSVSSKPAAPH